MYSSDPFSSTPSDGCCSPISSSSGFLSSSTKISSVEETRALKLAFELTMAGASTQHFFTSSPDSNVDEKFSNSNKKSQNMTECVPVPSSEHVAEIVGRQGTKIHYYIIYISYILLN
ncbi:MEX3C.2 family protein [Megaselia abdita]